MNVVSILVINFITGNCLASSFYLPNRSVHWHSIAPPSPPDPASSAKSPASSAQSAYIMESVTVKTNWEFPGKKNSITTKTVKSGQIVREQRQLDMLWLES